MSKNQKTKKFNNLFKELSGFIVPLSEEGESLDRRKKGVKSKWESVNAILENIPNCTTTYYTGNSHMLVLCRIVFSKKPLNDMTDDHKDKHSVGIAILKNGKMRIYPESKKNVVIKKSLYISWKEAVKVLSELGKKYF